MHTPTAPTLTQLAPGGQVEPPILQLREQYVKGGLPVVETSHAPLVPVVPAGAEGHVVPEHLGRQHS
eukprot:COSAG01_NODE_1299_length_10836_cov_8.277452_5_plen_67_part_00